MKPVGCAPIAVTEGARVRPAEDGGKDAGSSCAGKGSILGFAGRAVSFPPLPPSRCELISRKNVGDCRDASCLPASSPDANSVVCGVAIGTPKQTLANSAIHNKEIRPGAGTRERRRVEACLGFESSGWSQRVAPAVVDIAIPPSVER